jgi:hypothetical protein
LAPAYDVLPMGFAPRAGGALVDTLAPAALIATVDADTWRQALQLAENFFARLSDTAAFSPRFLPCIAALDRHIDEAARRIARLG